MGSSTNTRLDAGVSRSSQGFRAGRKRSAIELGVRPLVEQGLSVDGQGILWRQFVSPAPTLLVIEGPGSVIAVRPWGEERRIGWLVYIKIRSDALDSSFGF
jgi:hypothetical protein